jgi:outer membrane assembly lipoprotein YfiO
MTRTTFLQSWGKVGMPTRSLFVLVSLALAACVPTFRPQAFTSTTDLYRASLVEREAGRDDNAIAGLERLQIQLSPSDTLLPRVHYQLGALHVKKKQWLLAGQAFLRVPENFPEDTLADDALLGAADAYARLWRKPELDPKYGIEALATYNLLIRAYPSSPLLTAAGAGAAKMREWLAQKDVITGDHYFRRRAFDSALIYYGDAVKNYPGTNGARDALVHTIRTFRALEKFYKVVYDAEVAETCAKLRTEFAGDPVIESVCATGRAAPDSAR